MSDDDRVSGEVHMTDAAIERMLPKDVHPGGYLRLGISPDLLVDRVDYLIGHGSSLVINWGEDTGCFEVDWITGGERFRGVDRNLYHALTRALEAAIMRFGNLPVSGIG